MLTLERYAARLANHVILTTNPLLRRYDSGLTLRSVTALTGNPNAEALSWLSPLPDVEGETASARVAILGIDPAPGHGAEHPMAIRFSTIVRTPLLSAPVGGHNILVPSVLDIRHIDRMRVAIYERLLLHGHFIPDLLDEQR